MGRRKRKRDQRIGRRRDATTEDKPRSLNKKEVEFLSRHELSRYRNIERPAFSRSSQKGKGRRRERPVRDRSAEHASLATDAVFPIGLSAPEC